MASISTFLRKTPVPALRAYFEAAAFRLPVTIDWDGEEAEVVRPLLKAVNEMAETEKSKFLLEAERVCNLADEAGNIALLSVVRDRETFDTLEVGYACSLWVFLNERESFRKAEEVRYTDHRRHGRAWDGFVLAENCEVSTDPVALSAFRAAIRERFRTENVQIDVFERQRLGHDEEMAKLIQVAVYREGRPGAALRFSDAGNLTRHVDKPVYEAALTYEPDTGAIEVIADRKDTRIDLTRFMARDLLGLPFEEKRLPVLQYDLDVLLQPHDFARDFRDGIEAVTVTALRLVANDEVPDRFTLEKSALGDRSIWETAAHRFPGDNPMGGGWSVAYTKISVKFGPTATEPRGKTIALSITAPTGCNLKGMTAREQLISAKYLRRWGLLADSDLGDRDPDAVIEDA
jgi:hypothetical protein